MSTESNVIVFEDTVEMCRDTPRLMDSIVASRNGQRLILERDAVPSGRGIERFCEPAELVLTKHRTFQAAEKYIRSPRYAGGKGLCPEFCLCCKSWWRCSSWCQRPGRMPVPLLHPVFLS